jgi:hypothetical protein
VFFVNVPVGAIGILLGWFLLPRTRQRAARTALDWVGLAVLMPAVGALLLALSEASRLGVGNPAVPVLLVCSAVLFILFVLRERRAPHPLVDLSLFRTGRFSRGITTGLLCYLVLFGVLFVTPLYLEAAHGLPSAQAGLLLTVLPVALALVAPLAGITADRRGIRVPTSTGMGLTAAALGVLALFPGNLWVIGSCLGGIGLGLGFFTPANNAAVAAAGRDHQAGMVSGVLNMTRGVGTSLGIALAAIAYSLATGTASAATLAAASELGFRIAILILGGLAAVAAGISLAGRPTGKRGSLAPRLGECG